MTHLFFQVRPHYQIWKEVVKLATSASPFIRDWTRIKNEEKTHYERRKSEHFSEASTL